MAASIPDRDFSPKSPNLAQVTDITYIAPTLAGCFWLWCSTCLGQSVDWAMRSTQHADVVLQALLTAVWRRKPEPDLLPRSDHGMQFIGEEWQSFLKAHGIIISTRRKISRHDIAVAERFSQSLKCDWIKRKTYTDQAEVKADVFVYAKMLHNSELRHDSSVGVAPVQFEEQHSSGS